MRTHRPIQSRKQSFTDKRHKYQLSISTLDGRRSEHVGFFVTAHDAFMDFQRIEKRRSVLGLQEITCEVITAQPLINY